MKNIACVQQPNVASDWWSIGVIAYELLNGVVSKSLNVLSTTENGF
jgi:hypothetical protein